MKVEGSLNNTEHLQAQSRTMGAARSNRVAFFMPPIGDAVATEGNDNLQPNTDHMKKLKPKPAQWANSTPALVNIEQLSELKGPTVRQIRTMVAKKILHCYRFGYRSLFFSPEQFDRDVAAFKVGSVANRNGK